MSKEASEVEAELEAFRQQWREEVSTRNRRPGNEPSKVSSSSKHPVAQSASGPSISKQNDHIDYSEEVVPQPYHDLPDKEEHLKLGLDGQDHDRKGMFKEPGSALEHYELAVERESQGNLGESMRHYRKAFKLDDGVHEAYKRKHFPPSSFAKPKPTNVNPSNAAATVPNTAHHSLHGSSSDALPVTLKQMVDEFASLRIEAAEPPTSASPQEPCPLGELPEEILTNILTHVAVADVASFTALAQVCKRLAYLVLTEESIWRRVAEGSEFGFGAMHYDFACAIDGTPLDPRDRYPDAYALQNTVSEADAAAVVAATSADEPSSSTQQQQQHAPAFRPGASPTELAQAFSALSQRLQRTQYAASWRQLFRSRPRVRFNGCYISTVNYTRAGAASGNSLTWGAPIHIVTYFRYLRFFRDGGAISLLTTAEPPDVVHHLTRENLHKHHGSFLPSSVMKDALRGRWRLTGPASVGAAAAAAAAAAGAEPREEAATEKESDGGLDQREEREGDVVVETDGVVPKYTYKLQLALAHAGKTARNNKLAWKGFWSYNKLTDDWAEFGRKNYRAFYWSRVKSYGIGGDA